MVLCIRALNFWVKRTRTRLVGCKELKSFQRSVVTLSIKPVLETEIVSPRWPSAFLFDKDTAHRRSRSSRHLHRPSSESRVIRSLFGIAATGRQKRASLVTDILILCASPVSCLVFSIQIAIFGSCGNQRCENAALIPFFGDVFIQANVETDVKAKGRANQKSNPRSKQLAALRHAQGAYLIAR
jgi:hypothetical protein